MEADAWYDSVKRQTRLDYVAKEMGMSRQDAMEIYETIDSATLDDKITPLFPAQWATKGPPPPPPPSPLGRAGHLRPGSCALGQLPATSTPCGTYIPFSREYGTTSSGQWTLASGPVYQAHHRELLLGIQDVDC